MTCLLRTRGSVSEMVRLFAAEPDPGLVWPESIWPGDRVPVVIEEDGMRRLTTMAWGLPVETFVKPVPASQRGIIYPRDLWRDGSRLRDGRSLPRCLILLESFAYPMGTKGQCTRGWIGLWDHPVAAWAGVFEGGGCAGMLVMANERVEPLSSTMPHLLPSQDQTCWLERGSLLLLGPGYADAEYYRENLGERWSSGRPDEELPLFRAAS